MLGTKEGVETREARYTQVVVQHNDLTRNIRLRRRHWGSDVLVPTGMLGFSDPAAFVTVIESV